MIISYLLQFDTRLRMHELSIGKVGKNIHMNTLNCILIPILLHSLQCLYANTQFWKQNIYQPVWPRSLVNFCKSLYNLFLQIQLYTLCPRSLVHYSKSLYKNGQDFFDIRYIIVFVKIFIAHTVQIQNFSMYTECMYIIYFIYLYA